MGQVSSGLKDTYKKYREWETFFTANNIHVAAFNGSIHTVESMLYSGDTVHSTMDVARVGEMVTPLHCAAYNGHIGVCKFLLQQGADLHCRARDGATVLHMAAMNDQAKCIRFLLAEGARPDAVTKLHMLTPYDFALAKNNSDACQVLHGLHHLTEEELLIMHPERQMPKYYTGARAPSVLAAEVQLDADLESTAGSPMKYHNLRSLKKKNLQVVGVDPEGDAVHPLVQLTPEEVESALRNSLNGTNGHVPSGYGHAQNGYSGHAYFHEEDEDEEEYPDDEVSEGSEAEGNLMRGMNRVYPGGTTTKSWTGRAYEVPGPVVHKKHVRRGSLGVDVMLDLDDSDEDGDVLGNENTVKIFSSVDSRGTNPFTSRQGSSNSLEPDTPNMGGGVYPSSYPVTPESKYKQDTVFKYPPIDESDRDGDDDDEADGQPSKYLSPSPEPDEARNTQKPQAVSERPRLPSLVASEGGDGEGTPRLTRRRSMLPDDFVSEQPAKGSPTIRHSRHSSLPKKVAAARMPLEADVGPASPALAIKHMLQSVSSTLAEAEALNVPQQSNPAVPAGRPAEHGLAATGNLDLENDVNDGVELETDGEDMSVPSTLDVSSVLSGQMMGLSPDPAAEPVQGKEGVMKGIDGLKKALQTASIGEAAFSFVDSDDEDTHVPAPVPVTAPAHEDPTDVVSVDAAPVEYNVDQALEELGVASKGKLSSTSKPAFAGGQQDNPQMIMNGPMHHDPISIAAAIPQETPQKRQPDFVTRVKHQPTVDNKMEAVPPEKNPGESASFDAVFMEEDVDDGPSVHVGVSNAASPVVAKQNDGNKAILMHQSNMEKKNSEKTRSPRFPEIAVDTANLKNKKVTGPVVPLDSGAEASMAPQVNEKHDFLKPQGGSPGSKKSVQSNGSNPDSPNFPQQMSEMLGKSPKSNQKGSAPPSGGFKGIGTMVFDGASTQEVNARKAALKKDISMLEKEIGGAKGESKRIIKQHYAPKLESLKKELAGLS